MSIAEELGLTTEYTTIRAKDNQLVKVDRRISAEHQRILEAAYKAGAQDEREACAKRFEEMHARGDKWITTIAAATLARGE
jgi:hypothetical protein